MSITKTKKLEERKNPLVEIDRNLYNEIVDISREANKDFPSVKNFIEISIKKYINSIRYNIENNQPVLKEDTAVKPNKEFTKCIVCDEIFLSNKSEKGEKKRICQRCREVILHFAKKIENV